MNASRLEGITTMVTGGGLGIGAVYVEHLARAGASVAAVDIDGDAAEEVATRLSAEGLRAVGWSTDITDSEDVETSVAKVVSTFGGLDVLVNNAALFTALLPQRSFLDIDVAAWDQVMVVNVRGAFLCAKHAYPHLRESAQGRIINISSTTALTGTPGLLHYVTSKAAIFGLTRALAREVGADGVTVNAIAPGLTASSTAREKLDDDRFQAMASTRALGRVQVPEDLVGALVFLASEDSQFITGQTLVVDGGVHMQ